MEPLNKKEILQNNPTVSSLELDEYEKLLAKRFTSADGLTSQEEAKRLSYLHERIFKGGTKIVFEETYHGFESISDLSRDIEEALDPSFNPKMVGVPAEFQGTIKVVITYEEAKPAPVRTSTCDCRCHNIPREGFFHCFSPCKCGK